MEPRTPVVPERAISAESVPHGAALDRRRGAPQTPPRSDRQQVSAFTFENNIGYYRGDTKVAF